jgi:DNA repair protein RadC
MENLIRRPGRRVVRLITRKREPVTLSALSTEELLYVLLGNREAARAIAAETGGDLRKLVGKEIADLTVLQGVGDGAAAKIAVLFELVTRLVRSNR